MTENEVPKKYSMVHFAVIVILVVFTWIPIKLLAMDTVPNKEILVRLAPICFSLALSIFFMVRDFSGRRLLKLLPIYGAMILYFLLLPVRKDSQSTINAVFFGLIILWFFIWFSYSAFKIRNADLFSDFIQRTAETILWSTLCGIGGMVLILLSINLLKTIGIDAEDFYMSNIATLGVSALPFISLIVIERFDKIRLSVILANIFLPLFLVSIVAFGALSLFAEIKPYESRDVFIVYNLMLVIVICLLLFTKINNHTSRFIALCSTLLTLCTIVLDGILLSAILYRIRNYGMTPNKATLLASNIVMLGNLVYIIAMSIKHKEYKDASKRMTYYLPMYGLLALIVVFIFPAIFNFK